MKSILAAAAIAMAGILIAMPSTRASTLFQSVPDFSSPAAPDGACSACNGSYRAFDTFTLDSSSSIGSVTVSLYDASVDFPVNLSVSIWTISGGLPGTQLFSQTFTPAEFVSDVYPYYALVTVDPVGLSLLAGTYDISFYNPANLAVTEYVGGSGLLYQQGFGFLPGYSAGFILSGEVTPLPATLPLFASGMGVIGLFGWLKRRRHSVTSDNLHPR